jgi:hypothetical protein
MPELLKISGRTDESFNPEETGQYDLSVQVNGKQVSWCVLDERNNKFIALESYENTLPVLEEHIPWLKKPFRNTRVMVVNNRSTLVPAPLFDSNEKEAYLEFVHDPTEWEAVGHDPIPGHDIVNVYSLPDTTLADIKRIFPSAGIMHVATALIESIALNFRNHIAGNTLFLHVRDQEFDIIIFDGRQLVYYNSFRFMDPADLMYYVIFVMEQLSLNPEKTPVILMGEVEKESPVFGLLYKYVRNVDFAARNAAFGYSYVFDGIAGHRFYPLLNLVLCGS